MSTYTFNVPASTLQRMLTPTPGPLPVDVAAVALLLDVDAGQGKTRPAYAEAWGYTPKGIRNAWDAIVQHARDFATAYGRLPGASLEQRLDAYLAARIDAHKGRFRAGSGQVQGRENAPDDTDTADQGQVQGRSGAGSGQVSSSTTRNTHHASTHTHAGAGAREDAEAAEDRPPVPSGDGSPLPVGVGLPELAVLRQEPGDAAMEAADLAALAARCDESRNGTWPAVILWRRVWPNERTLTNDYQRHLHVATGTDPAALRLLWATMEGWKAAGHGPHSVPQLIDRMRRDARSLAAPGADRTPRHGGRRNPAPSRAADPAAVGAGFATLDDLLP